MQAWKGDDLSGTWTVTWKLDGVQAIVNHEGAFSRNGKPLFNLRHLPHGIYEIFKDNWETTVSMVRTRNGKEVSPEYAFRLEPLIDERLWAGIVENPTSGTIREFMRIALKKGHEGLVLRKFEKRLKVKPKETHDVPITGVIPGMGKFRGKMGALETPKGSVGTGFTDEERGFPWHQRIGEIIEVACVGMTPGGKFRHPRFVRVRVDK